MKLLTVVGARPQFIKAAALARVLPQFPSIEHVLVHTGQHYDSNMNDVFFEEMRIPRPNFHLEVKASHHGAMTGQMLTKLDEILVQTQPDALLVYGDTNSTLAGALAAVKFHIPVVHVEAGLRSFNRAMPEEINRVLTDRMSTLLLCPTEQACKNLREEGTPEDAIHLVGDVMYDTALFYSKIAQGSEAVAKLSKQEFFLCSIHRAENTDHPETLKRLADILNEISQRTPVVMPLHPRTKKLLEQNQIVLKNVHLLPPVGYFDMLTLLKNCSQVLTDSGGLQKEAYFFQKPCVTFRTETEWIELVEKGFNKIVGSDRKKALAAIEEFTLQPPHFSQDLYGDGNASAKILELIEKKLS